MSRKLIFIFFILLILSGCKRQYDMLGGNDVYLYESIQLSVEDFIIDDEEHKIVWNSSNTNIATIDEEGILYGVSVGEVYITAKYKSKYIARKYINVLRGAEIDVNGDDTIAIGDTKSLEVTSEILGDEFTFESMDTNILTIDSKGEFTGVSKGSTSITVRSKYHGYYSFDINVIENYDPESLDITNILEEDYIGEVYKLSAIVHPEFANQNVSWEVVGNKAVLNENNEIKFNDIGEVTVICRSEEDNSIRKVVNLNARYADDIEVTNILFLGNSHTYFNDVPGIVEGIGKANGNPINCEHISEGGATVSLLITKYYDDLINHLETTNYQYIIVQEQSSLNFLDYDNFLSAVTQLQEITSPYDVEILLYQTWAYEEDSPSLNNVRLTYEEMHQLITESYHNVSNTTGLNINPVGEVFDAFKHEYPETRLYHDGNHANRAGSYLSACVHYYNLFNESLIGNEFEVYFDEDIKILIQEFVSNYFIIE